MFTSKLSNAINRYDPYGIMRVNALQSLMVTICILLVNFIFSPPYIQQLLPIFVVGLIASATSASYLRRQQIVIAFSIIAMIWTIAMNLVLNHNLASVLMTGFLLSGMFLIGKKIPLFASIAVLCYILGVVLPPIKSSGSIYAYYNFIAMTVVILILIIAFMNLFPRVYYLRIWVRAYSLCLKELAVSMRELTRDDTKIQNFTHLTAIYRITLGLTHKEYTFAARKVNISLLTIYKFFTTMRMGLLELNQAQLLEIAQTCENLYQKISHDQPLTQTISNTTELPRGIYYALNQLILQWNKLCSKT